MTSSEQGPKKMRHRPQGPQTVSSVLASVVGVLERRYPALAEAGILPVTLSADSMMTSHNRRDPKLPNLTPSEQLKAKSLGEIMERARKKMGVKTVWERYGERAQSGTERGLKEKE